MECWPDNSVLRLTQSASSASRGQLNAMIIRDICPPCQSPKYQKNRHSHHGKQHYHGNECGRQFVACFDQDLVSEDTRVLIERLLVERISWRSIRRAAGVRLKWLLGLIWQFSTVPAVPLYWRATPT